MATLEQRAKQVIRDIRRSCNACRETRGGVCREHFDACVNLILDPQTWVPQWEAKLSGKEQPS